MKHETDPIKGTYIDTVMPQLYESINIETASTEPDSQPRLLIRLA
jgi:hypothetical protein